MHWRLWQRGLSLIELMISMLIGSVIILGVLNLFTANLQTYNVLQAQSRLQEGAHYGLNVMNRDVRKTGYRGCYSSGDLYAAVTTIAGQFDIRTAFSVFNGGDTGWSSSNTALPSLISATAQVGTDILVLRYIGNDEAYLTNPIAPGNASIVVAADPANSAIVEDDIALLHDCEKATLFEVTGISVSESDGTITFGHDTTTALAETGTFGTDASVSSIRSRTYFIRQGANGLEGSGGLSLYRDDGDGSQAYELVEGIEDFQITLGIDTDSDGVPNQYVAPSADLDVSRVVVMMVEMTANSVSPVGSSESDGLLRRAFRQTIQLRNPG